MSYKIIDSYVTAIVQYYTTLSFDAQHINTYLRNKSTTKRLKNSYLLNAIIKEEKIEVSKEDAEKEIKDMAIKHNMAEEDVKQYVGGIEAMIYDLKVRRAIDLMK